MFTHTYTPQQLPYSLLLRPPWAMSANDALVARGLFRSMVNGAVSVPTCFYPGCTCHTIAGERVWYPQDPTWTTQPASTRHNAEITEVLHTCQEEDEVLHTSQEEEDTDDYEEEEQEIDDGEEEQDTVKEEQETDGLEEREEGESESEQEQDFANSTASTEELAEEFQVHSPGDNEEAEDIPNNLLSQAALNQPSQSRKLINTNPIGADTKLELETTATNSSQTLVASGVPAGVLL